VADLVRRRPAALGLQERARCLFTRPPFRLDSAGFEASLLQVGEDLESRPARPSSRCRLPRLHGIDLSPAHSPQIGRVRSRGFSPGACARRPPTSRAQRASPSPAAGPPCSKPSVRRCRGGLRETPRSPRMGGEEPPQQLPQVGAGVASESLPKETWSAPTSPAMLGDRRSRRGQARPAVQVIGA
jgi:hypothetical protein